MDVRLPDGTIIKNVPEGTTKADLVSKLQRNGMNVPSEWMGAEPAAQRPAAAPMSRLEKVGQGIVDPVNGGAQLLTHLLPDSVVQAGNRANNWLADKTGLVARLPEGGVDQQVREQEKQYQDKRAAAGESGVDWWRVGGNVVSPVNLTIGRLIPGGGGLAARTAKGAVNGAVSGGLAPTTTEDGYWSEKAKQIGLSAIGGGAVPAAVAGMSRVISPLASRAQDLALLRSEGVRTTLGQTLGGMANTLEQKAMSLPLLGDTIRAARQRSMNDLNTAVANRALAPVGQQLPPGVKGREAVDAVKNALGDAYDNVLLKLNVKADAPFMRELAQTHGMVQTGALAPTAVQAFNRILTNDVLPKLQGQGAMTGQTLKAVESDLGQQISRLSASTDADQRLIADALKNVRASLRDLAARTNPGAAKELAAINGGYANFKRLEKAASYVSAEDGVFTPSQLQTAVKALDRSKDKGAFARGDALMQDLSDAAKGRLGNGVPDSGTAGRLALPAMLGAAIYDPSKWLQLAALPAGSLLYSRPAQWAARGLLASRPAAAEKVAGLLDEASPMLAPAGGLLAVGVGK